MPLWRPGPNPGSRTISNLICHKKMVKIKICPYEQIGLDPVENNDTFSVRVRVGVQKIYASVAKLGSTRWF